MIDVADSLVPQFQVGVDFEAFCKHDQLHLVRLEDEHSTFSSTVSYELTNFFSEAFIIIIELYCMPCSTIWVSETIFFMMVGACRTFFM